MSEPIASQPQSFKPEYLRFTPPSGEKKVEEAEQPAAKKRNALLKEVLAIRAKLDMYISPPEPHSVSDKGKNSYLEFLDTLQLAADYSYRLKKQVQDSADGDSLEIARDSIKQSLNQVSSRTRGQSKRELDQELLDEMRQQVVKLIEITQTMPLKESGDSAFLSDVPQNVNGDKEKLVLGMPLTKFKEAVSTLAEQDKKVLEMTYLSRHDINKTAENLKCKPDEVPEILKQALDRLSQITESFK
jgi:hypothetical protein